MLHANQKSVLVSANTVCAYSIIQ